MSILDTPYYFRAGGGAPRGGSAYPGLLPAGAAALHFGGGTGRQWGHHHRGSAHHDGLLDHRLPNMGMFEHQDGEQEQQNDRYRDVAPGFVSPPTSPQSPGDAALHAYASLPVNPFTHSVRVVRAMPMAELRRHQAETGMLPYASDQPEVPVVVGAAVVDPSNPLGAKVIVEEAEYVIEAPTPGVPRERLSLEIVGLRRVELVVAPPPGSGSSSPREVLETVDVEGPAAGSTTCRRAGGARVGASPARTTGELKCGVSLPTDCDLASASSTYVDGVLRVTVPRVPEGGLPSGLAVAGAPLLEEVREGKRRVEDARQRLSELEALVKDAEEKLRNELMEQGAALEEARTELPIL